MKREKGFTLIELLAVIIILSVIMVIAVPKVLDVINKSKEGAFIDSAYGISDSVKYYYFQNHKGIQHHFCNLGNFLYVLMKLLMLEFLDPQSIYYNKSSIFPLKIYSSIQYDA